METHHRPSGDGYGPARNELEVTIAYLCAPAAGPRDHSTVEEFLRERGNEIERLLYQAYLQHRSAEDRREAEARAAVTGASVHAVTRPIESLFGKVTLERCAAPATPDTPRDFPLDRVLNLPHESYTLPVRQRVAELARNVSMEQTVQGIDRTTGAHVPKRQVEELVARAAQDFDAFYAQRPPAANDTTSDATLLVLSCDSKGVTMVPTALRDATRKTAQSARATQPAHSDPMAPRKKRKHDKRMAIVTAVYDQEPHVRTTTDVVQGLLRKPQDPARPAPPRPRNKTVAASVVKSQKDGIREMFDEGARRDPEHLRQTVVLVDGEERQQATIKEQARVRRWSITMIVDLIHVLSYVWKAAAALFKSDPARIDVSVTSYLQMLLDGDVRLLARHLRRLATEQKLSPEERKPVDRCVGYLRKNAKYLRYDQYLAAGYPLATGVIEGACRHLVEDRMGITGARWDLVSADAVLRLRALAINGDWDAYWNFHQEQHKLRNTLKRAS